MENIRQAIERARAVHSSSKSQVLEKLDLLRVRRDSSAVVQNTTGTHEIEINSSDLISRRIVSHNGGDQRSRPYDMLRTQVLQSMDLNGWKILGVTSPTPGCGKTLTAINLAFSIARQPNSCGCLSGYGSTKTPNSEQSWAAASRRGSIGSAKRTNHVAKRGHAGSGGKPAHCGSTNCRYQRVVVGIDELSCNGQLAAGS